MQKINQKEVWNKIAKDWFVKRSKPFKQITKELQNLSNKKSGKILDIGCGNCRNLLMFAKKKFDCYGVDFSKEMIKYAKEFCNKNNIKVNLKVANAERLPFKDNFFDYILFIAVLHHVNNKKKALQELKRVLKDNGLALITVWNRLQLRFIFKPKELYVSWGKHLRYYYLFNYFEFKKLLKSLNFKIIKSKGMFNKNLIFLVRK